MIYSIGKVSANDAYLKETIMEGRRRAGWEN